MSCFCFALEVDTVLIRPLWEAPASVQADRALLIRLVFLMSLDCFTFWIQSELPERTLLRSFKKDQILTRFYDIVLCFYFH